MTKVRKRFISTAISADSAAVDTLTDDNDNSPRNPVDMKLRYATRSGYSNSALSSTFKMSAFCLTVLIGLASCSKSDTIDNREYVTSKPATVATTDPDQVAGQTITHRDEQTSERIAEVHIPTGALAVNQTVTMKSSYHTDPSDLLDEFNIDKTNSVKESNVATVVSSNVDKNLDQPMTIALDLPAAQTSLFGLVYDKRNFFVVYTVRDSKAKVWRRGIMPEKSLTLDKNRIVFKSEFMGRYEVFESVQPVETDQKVEKAVAKPDFVNPPVAVTAIAPLVARPDDTVKVSGKYFTSKTEVRVAGAKVDGITWLSSNTMQFKMPKTTFGKQVVSLHEGTNSAEGSIIINTFGATTPYIAAEAAEVCIGTSYANAAGVLSGGLKVCKLPACKEDSEQGCLSSADYPAFKTTDIDPSQMFTGLTVHKIRGSIPSPDYTLSCERNAQANCQASDRYVAITDGLLTPSKVKKNYRIPKFGPNGADLVGDFPSQNNPLPKSNALYGVLNGSDLANQLGTNAGKTYQYWDMHGQPHRFQSQIALKPTAIKNGVKIFGVTGNSPVKTKDPCSASKHTDCYADGNYLAFDSNLLHEKNIAAGKALAGVLGKYPSEDYPLWSEANVLQLSSSNFNETMRAGRVFEYFDSAGNRYAKVGSSNLLPSHIKKDVTLFDVTGTLEPFNAAAFKEDNIRYGVKIGNVTGNYKTNCRSMARTDKHNYKVLPAKDGLDIYDTITAHDLPSSNPWPGQDGYVCDENRWEDVTAANGKTSCTSLSQDCAWRDRSTQLIWGGYHLTETFGNYNHAYQYCQNLEVGSRTEWRLPTIDQLKQAYVNGITNIRKQHSQFLLWPNGHNLWSGTGWGPDNAREVYYIYPRSGKVKKTLLTGPDQTNALCVHD